MEPYVNAGSCLASGKVIRFSKNLNIGFNVSKHKTLHAEASKHKNVKPHSCLSHQEPSSGTETVSAGSTRPHRKRQMCYF